MGEIFRKVAGVSPITIPTLGFGSGGAEPTLPGELSVRGSEEL
jgi:hypothetical protein